SRHRNDPASVPSAAALTAARRAVAPALAAAVAVPTAAAGALTVTTRRTVAAAGAAATRTAGLLQVLQLLGGLAGDLGIVRQAQADAAALAVELGDADLDDVALRQHLFDRVDAVA